jgi:malonyl-CoA O-methyltransferase
LHKPDITRVHQRFQRGLATYSEAAVVQRRMAQTLCASLLQTTPMRQFGTVLDLGCGTGLLTDAFVSACTWDTLHLYDLLEACQPFHAQRPNAQFHKADLNIYDSYPEADLILSGATFQWIHDLDALLGRLHRVLKPEGLLAFSTFGPENLKEVHAISDAGLTYIPAQRLSEKLQTAGFEVLLLKESQEVLTFASPRDVLEHLKATGVTASAKNSVWTKATLRAFEENYEAFRTPDNRYPLTYKPVYCIAKKVEDRK